MQSFSGAVQLDNFSTVRFVIHYDVPESVDAYVNFSRRDVIWLTQTREQVLPRDRARRPRRQGR